MANINEKWPGLKNVGLAGTFPEELKALQKLEKNPDASPVPDLAPSRLLAPRRSSEDLRIGGPVAATAEAQENVQTTLTHVTLRRLLMRRRKKGWTHFERAVEDESLEDLPSARREQMRSMLKREQAMLELLERYNQLAEGVYMRLLSEAKG
jgi:hypothetical protein